MKNTINNLIRERFENGNAIRFSTEEDYVEVAKRLNIPPSEISDSFIEEIHQINDLLLEEMQNAASKKYYLNTTFGKNQMETFKSFAINSK